MDKNMLFVLPEDSQTGKSFLSTQYVLRQCNRDFRNITGYMGQFEDIPELDNVKTPGKIAPLMTFDNTFGHWVNGMTRTFPPRNVESILEFTQLIRSYVEYNVSKSTLWDLDRTSLYMYDKIKSRANITPEFMHVAHVQQKITSSPISVHTVQAYLECEKRRGKVRLDEERKKFNPTSLFLAPSQSTVVTGIHGGLHNNTNLEMGFVEKDGQRDAAKRTFDTRLSGYVCSGHTAHSGDAGKNRRIAAYTRVRVIHPGILDCISRSDIDSHEERDWILYCMGISCHITADEVWDICYILREESMTYYKDQFPDSGGPGDMLCPASFTVYEEEKILVLSISSGVILRSMPDDSMIDSVLMNYSSCATIMEVPKLPTCGPDVLKYRYSATFMLGNFIEHDRPPRTLFASGQTTQGIFAPWSVGTARVSPVHLSRPLVATEFVRKIERDHELNDEAIWDVYPGEDLLVCYHNMPLNYEDSMIISSAFADRGGYSTLSLCTYRISESEEVPKIGERLCGKKYKWWKVECTRACVCNLKGASKFKDINKVISTSADIPSGIVHQIIRTEDGGMSIKVISYSQILTGDKVSTMHGQKGIARVYPQHELPVICMEDGSRFYADIYIAVGSIVSRQTNGQIYDSAHGLRAARNGQMMTTEYEVDTSSESFKYLIRPSSGKILARKMHDGTTEIVRGTVGITRVINQTQMTRERQHLTHRPEGKNSTGTRSGRADGGGVAASEMDFHAMFSSGLIGCAQELFDRGNMSIVPVCTLCHAIDACCDCGFKGENLVMVRMPYDSASFDQISAAANGTCNRYYVEHI